MLDRKRHIGVTSEPRIIQVEAGFLQFFARAAGMDDVFAHGMLSMAYLAQMLTRWVPQARLRRWTVRFVAITPLHATVTCRGTVTDIFEEAGERLARVKIGSWIEGNVPTLDGEAVVALA